MSVRFVNFKIAGGDEILINPIYVVGTLEEVVAKL